MAEVFLAQVEGPGGFSKPVVVKRVLPELSKDQQFVAMFLSEAKLVAQLNHPNIVQVFDFGFDRGSYYLVMEYVDGSNLRALFKQAYTAQQPLPFEQAAKMVASACEGLAFAHSFMLDGKPLDLIHRDISPENLLVGRNGVVKVADFGIARVAGQKRMTRTGTVRGKLVYMAPEQMMGEAVDCRVDVFALGIVLYELICGRRPFEAKTEVDAMQAILKGKMTPAITWRPDCPPELQQIIDRAMARDKAQRFADCTALQAALEQFIAARGLPANAASIGKLVAQHIEPPPPMPSLGVPTVILPPREVKTLEARPAVRDTELELPALRARPSAGKMPLIGAGVGLAAVAVAAWALWPAEPELVALPPVAAVPEVIAAPPLPPTPAPAAAKPFSDDDYPVAPPPGEPPKTATPVRTMGKARKEAKVAAPAPEPAPVAAPPPPPAPAPAPGPVEAAKAEPAPLVAAEAPKPAVVAPVPGPAPAPARAVLRGRLSFDTARGVLLFNDTDFRWTACEVRMPQRKVYKMEDPIEPTDSDNIRLDNFEDDRRLPDQHMQKGWAMVRCREAGGYLWWGPSNPF